MTQKTTSTNRPEKIENKARRTRGWIEMTKILSFKKTRTKKISKFHKKRWNHKKV